MAKKTGLNINGILLLDKPLGITSNAALQRAKHLFNAKKAGHTGSLDPLATGMLPLCFGDATRFSQFLLDADKYYRVRATLGIKTTTGDAEGEVIATRAVQDITVEKITAVLQEFSGHIEQIPPMFSALKHQGRPLYVLARKGIEVERQPRSVTIHALTLLSWDVSTNVFEFDVHCTKGTYVRTLVEDIGEKLGCGAHVSGLRRTAVHPYQQQPMLTLAALETMQAAGESLTQLLLPVDSSVQHLPAARLSSSAAFYIKTGQAVRVPHTTATGLVRIFLEEGLFLGVGEITDDGRVAPKRLVSL